MMASKEEAVRRVLVHRMVDDEGRLDADDVAVEDPLELRIRYVEGGRPTETTICVTMRTPGADVELAIGYLHAEGVITSAAGLRATRDGSTLTVDLGAPLEADPRRLQRNVFTSSSCGVCSVPSLDALAHAACPDLPPPHPMIAARVIHSLPGTLFERQKVFRETGGLHAAALFDADGRLLRVREDVGRHNAMDKLVGSCLLEKVPLQDRVVLVSGRSSYELVQKAIVAGVPVLAAVGAPSSLAIDLAQAHGLTLLGFVREGRFNVYHGEERFLRPVESEAGP